MVRCYDIYALGLCCR